jgi:hypothetical protein
LRPPPSLHTPRLGPPGLFYLTYGALQVPSACLALSVGLRWWYGAIIIGWGMVACATALVRNEAQVRGLTGS